MASTVDRGRHAESMAAAFLSLRGYVLCDRNLRFGPLEIDLVMERDDVLVVVEVKYRERSSLGGPAGAVTAAKRRRLETAAVRYLLRRGITARKVRFDLVLIEAPPGGSSAHLRHIPGAFPATGRYRL